MYHSSFNYHYSDCQNKFPIGTRYTSGRGFIGTYIWQPLYNGWQSIIAIAPASQIAFTDDQKKRGFWINAKLMVSYRFKGKVIGLLIRHAALAVDFKIGAAPNFFPTVGCMRSGRWRIGRLASIVTLRLSIIGSVELIGNILHGDLTVIHYQEIDPLLHCHTVITEVPIFVCNRIA